MTTMKSKIVENLTDDNPEEGQYSELQVLHSNAGYYIGTIFTDNEGFQEPGSRDSQYFKRFEDAEDFLKKLNEGSKEHISQLREHP